MLKFRYSIIKKLPKNKQNLKSHNIHDPFLVYNTYKGIHAIITIYYKFQQLPTPNILEIRTSYQN